MVLFLNPLDQVKQSYNIIGPEGEHGFEQDSELRESEKRSLVSQLNPQMPQEKMGEHGGEHVTVPCLILSHLIMYPCPVRILLLQSIAREPTGCRSAIQRSSAWCLRERC